MNRETQRVIVASDGDDDATCGIDCEECWFVWTDDFDADDNGKCHTSQLRVSLIEIARFT